MRSEVMILAFLTLLLKSIVSMLLCFCAAIMLRCVAWPLMLYPPLAGFTVCCSVANSTAISRRPVLLPRGTHITTRS